jgi:hypothetical protein
LFDTPPEALSDTMIEELYNLSSIVQIDWFERILLMANG